MEFKVKSFVASDKDGKRTKTVKYVCTIFDSPEELRDALITYCEGKSVTAKHDGREVDVFRGVKPEVAFNYGHGLKLRARADSSAFAHSDGAKIDSLKAWVRAKKDPSLQQEFLDASLADGTKPLLNLYAKYQDDIDGHDEYFPA